MRISTLAILAVVGSASWIQPAFADVCYDLWYERNSIYKARGYCFKTPAAIRAFGNEGCYVERERDIRFTPAERRQIERIRAAERDLGCS